MLLNHISETAAASPTASSEWLGAHGATGSSRRPTARSHLVEFRLEAGLPIWRYALRGVVIESGRC